MDAIIENHTILQALLCEAFCKVLVYAKSFLQSKLSTNTTKCTTFTTKSSLKWTLYWFIAASSSANACAFNPSSIPFVCESNLADDAAVPNDELVEDRAETPLFTFFWLLLFVR